MNARTRLELALAQHGTTFGELAQPQRDDWIALLACALEEVIDATRADVQRLKEAEDEIHDLSTEVDDLEVTKRDLEDEVADLKGQVESANTRADELQAELDQATDRIGELETELNERATA